MSIIGQAGYLGAIGLAFLAGFSRFTHGQYTPTFYQYQLDRAPDDESMRFVPFVDITFGILLLLPKIRRYAALLFTAFLGFGVYLRIDSGKSPTVDILHFLLGLTAFLYTSRA